jgi:hypothetical protein
MTNLTSYMECPTIYVSLSADTDPRAYQWVEIGAEEEGVPCRLVDSTGGDAVNLAYAAAQGSRLGVGVGIAESRAALHEAHMPPAHPVFAIDLQASIMLACRLMGSNAGRMVKHMPLRLALVEPEISDPADIGPAVPIVEAPISTDATVLAEMIARVLRQRGIR